MSLLRLPGHLLFACLLHLLIGLSLIQQISLTTQPALPSTQPTAVIVHLQPAPEPTTTLSPPPAPKPALKKDRTLTHKTRPRRRPAPDVVHDKQPGHIPEPEQNSPTSGVSKPVPDAVTAPAALSHPDIAPSARQALQTTYLQQLHRLLQRHQHYPRLSRQRGEQGTVVVQFDIQNDRLHNIQLHRASASQRLNQAALRSVHHLDGVLPPLPAALSNRPWSVRVPIIYQLH